jgi:hypothetical protein
MRRGERLIGFEIMDASLSVKKANCRASVSDARDRRFRQIGWQLVRGKGFDVHFD